MAINLIQNFYSVYFWMAKDPANSSTQQPINYQIIDFEDKFIIAGGFIDPSIAGQSLTVKELCNNGTLRNNSYVDYFNGSPEIDEHTVRLGENVVSQLESLLGTKIKVFYD